MNIVKMAGWKVASLIGYVTLVIVIMVVNVQGSVSDDVAAIEAQADRLEESFRAGDLETFVNTYTEDCRLFFPDFPELRGKAGQLVDLYSYYRHGDYLSAAECYINYFSSGT